MVARRSSTPLWFAAALMALGTVGLELGSALADDEVRVLAVGDIPWSLTTLQWQHKLQGAGGLGVLTPTDGHALLAAGVKAELPPDVPRWRLEVSWHGFALVNMSDQSEPPTLAIAVGLDKADVWWFQLRGSGLQLVGSILLESGSPVTNHPDLRVAFVVPQDFELKSSHRLVVMRSVPTDPAMQIQPAPTAD